MRGDALRHQGPAKVDTNARCDAESERANESGPKRPDIKFRRANRVLCSGSGAIGTSNGKANHACKSYYAQEPRYIWRDNRSGHEVSKHAYNCQRSAGNC